MCWWLFYSEYFKIKNIQIEGTVNDDIKNEIDNFKGNNIFLFAIGQKDKELAKHQSSIEKLNIIKGIPDTLQIKVTVRTPQLRWKTQDKIYFIDDDGIIFSLDNPKEESNKLPLIIDTKNLPVVNGSKYVSWDFIDFTKKLVEQLPSKAKKEISELKISDTTMDMEIQFKDSYKIFVSTISNIDDQLYLLSKVIENHDKDIKEYIDLRVEKRAYYK